MPSPATSPSTTAYGNTGSCTSEITYIDGDAGHPALPRHPDRGDRWQLILRRDRVARHLRAPAHDRGP
ncbi:MAG: hypothetical protein V9F04_01615 [Dermatophilaceae bacterium]